jgi:hypothetical protein
MLGLDAFTAPPAILISQALTIYLQNAFATRDLRSGARTHRVQKCKTSSASGSVEITWRESLSERK